MDEILNSIIAEIENNTTLYADINIGSMPIDDGISAYIGAGGDNKIYFNKARSAEFFLTINAKNKDGQVVLNTLSDIHKYITGLKTYPIGETWEIIDISGGFPNYTSQEDNGQWIYSSVFKVNFYMKGAN